MSRHRNALDAIREGLADLDDEREETPALCACMDPSRIGEVGDVCGMSEVPEEDALAVFEAMRALRRRANLALMGWSPA